MEIRPSFQIDLDWSPTESSRRLQAVFAQDRFRDRGQALGGVAEIGIPVQRQRLWSPHLSVVIDRRTSAPYADGCEPYADGCESEKPRDDGDPQDASMGNRASVGKQSADKLNAAVLRGRFAPRPAVWTAVMMIYFSGTFLVLCGLAWGYAQWAMGGTAWALWVMPLGIALFAAVHVAGRIGQALSSDQMAELRDLLDDAIQAMTQVDNARSE